MNRQIIHILTSKLILRRILADALTAGGGWTIEEGGGLDAVAALPVGPPSKRLVLVDLSETDPATFGERLTAIAGRESLLIALFNVEPGTEVGQDWIHRGLKGVFFADDSLELYRKGLDAIFKGDLWFSRKVLVRSILNGGNNHQETPLTASNLSLREMEILRLLAEGESNKRIANHLNISPFTVKSHLYHIFKKIGVGRRFEAARWAERFLRGKVG